MQLKQRYSILKKQKNYFYSGKKKKHTLKAQIVVNAKNLKVICVCISKGKTYDFSLFKNSKLAVHKDIKIISDSGYQRITKYHKNS